MRALMPQTMHYVVRLGGHRRTARRCLRSIRILAAVTVMVAGLSPVFADDCVIVLHGLARTSSSMAPVADALTAAGYTVRNIDYPSRKHTVQHLAMETLPRAIASCPEHDKLHFVTHSMGGILLRYYLAQTELERLGRTVMLAPPNQGSEIVDKLGTMPGFSLWNGPAGLQLGTQSDSIPSTLGAFPGELGVIAGTSTFNPLLSSLIPGPDDGKVAVARTRVDGMDDFIELAHTHTFMMKAHPVHTAVLNFLATGQF